MGRVGRAASRRRFPGVLPVLAGGVLVGIAVALAGVTARGQGQAARPPWVPDRGDGSYRNPVLYADYSDPDVVRVGNDYYLTASSFNAVPGLPILHSTDLVNWTLIGHALPRLLPEETFSTPQHGKGPWAPAIRYHAGRFWIYYPEPDMGIFVVTASDPEGPWSQPVMVKAGKGLIDPCPLWDDDGQVYLVHAWARSRAGIANVLTLNRLSADGQRTTDEGKVIIDGEKIPGCTTLEGPKLYKRGEFYWVFAPAGSVKTGWQYAFRARAIDGPYEHRIILEQGTTDINGPHQGAWVETPGGENWFLHFQDLDAYGRVVHLQPMTWRADGWPVVGSDPDGDGKGEPVRTAPKPREQRASAVAVPATSDEFDSKRLGLQWQWQANPRAEWFSLTAAPEMLRLYTRPSPAADNLWMAPHLLLQKWPAPEFTATAALRFTARTAGEAAGLIVFGQDYAWIGLRRAASGLRVVVRTMKDAPAGGAEQEQAGMDCPWDFIYLRVTVSPGGRCRFSMSMDNRTFTPLGDTFIGRAGVWVGAKVGLFALAPPGPATAGYADWDWFRVEPVAASGAR
jgi:beta-xylosidase